MVINSETKYNAKIKYFNYIYSIILKNRFSVSYKNGVKHYQNGNVKSVEVKELDKFINIYGRVHDRTKVYFTQIRLNKESKKIDFICNCDLIKEVRKSGSTLSCEHIIATALKLNEKFKNLINIDEKENVKVKLKIEENYDKEYRYRVALFLEGSGRIKISEAKELSYNVFRNNGVFSLDRVDFSKTNIKLFDFLNKIDFKVKDGDVRKLFILSKDAALTVKVDSIVYSGNVIEDSLPLKFTLKTTENSEGNALVNRIKLQGIKTKLKNLNNEGSVFLFNNHIYLPPINKCRSYVTIYKAFNDKFYTYVNMQSLEKVIKILRGIGDLKINDEVVNLLALREKINIEIFKQGEKLFLKFVIPKEKEYLRKSDKIKNIEEILYSNRFTKKDDMYVFVGDDDNVINLLRSNLNSFCTITSSNENLNFKILSCEDIKGNVTEKSDGIMLDIDLDGIDSREIDFAVKSYEDNADYYKFNDYSFLDFKDDNTKKLMDFLSFINFKGEIKSLPYGYEEAIKELDKNKIFLNLINKNNEESKCICKKPKHLNAKLREYQKDGFMWLQDKKSKGLFGILADDMGLGKTIQTISFIAANKNDKTLIIAPAFLVYNWQAEFYKFAPDIKVACIHGTKKTRVEIINELEKYDVFLTSYGSLNMDLEYYKDYIFDNIIIDEAQTIKNSKSKISSSIKSLNGKVKFALTGTPIENNYLEIWNIFDFLKHGYLFSEKEFKNKFLSNNSNVVKYLKLITKPFILRRTKSEVLKELPEKIEKNYYVDMTSKQKKYYKDSLKKYIKDIRLTNNHISILSYLTRLRQISLDPSIIDDDYEGGSGKIDACIEIVRDAIKINKKVIIFSQFTTLLSKLKEELNLINVKYLYLDGKTKPSKRVLLSDEFNHSKDIKVFLISLKAGGTGLNLTSAEIVIHFDLWWNPAVINQATDRAYRIGQKNEVNVIKIISKGTIEEKILKLNEEKNNMFKNLLDCDNVSEIKDTKLSKDEIEYLLSE